MDLYYSYYIRSTDEVVLGLLSQFDFESFEEGDDHIIGYIKADALTPEVTEEISIILNDLSVAFTAEKVENQNWNAIWEASFQPVIVHHFCQIRADFHPALEDIKYDLVINPKMAFGTGHHATTYMMIDQMEGIDFEGKSVFDFGCGTGILAILASKLGADPIDAVDIETESYDNTIVNAEINHVSNITTYCGDIDAVPFVKYDVLLANINRNILLKYTEDLVSRTHSDGHLLLSGILVDDADQVITAFEEHDFSHIKSLDRDGWKCILFKKG